MRFALGASLNFSASKVTAWFKHSIFHLTKHLKLSKPSHLIQASQAIYSVLSLQSSSLICFLSVSMTRSRQMVVSLTIKHDFVRAKNLKYITEKQKNKCISKRMLFFPVPTPIPIFSFNLLGLSFKSKSVVPPTCETF